MGVFLLKEGYDVIFGKKIIKTHALVTWPFSVNNIGVQNANGGGGVSIINKQILEGLL